MKYTIKSMKEIIITYILQILIIFILCIIYNLTGGKNLNHFINSSCSIILLIFYLITIIYLILKNKQNEPKINYKNLYFLISIGLSTAIIYNMIIFKITNTTNKLLIPLPLAIISSGIIGPIYEEILFRYIFLTRLTHKYSTPKAILINTLIFSLIHLNPIKMIYAFILGLILNLSYYKYKNILAPITIHISANIIVLFLTNYNTQILLLSIFLFIITLPNYKLNLK